MNLMRCSQVFLCLVIVVSMVTVDAGRCQKADKEKKGKDRKCQKKRDKNSKPRVGRYKANSKTTEAAPSWRRGPPKTDLLIVREGSDTSMNCAIRGNPSPAFSWKRNGKSLAVNSSRKYRQKRSRLWVKSLAISDTGTYTCVAVNKLGELEFTYSLKVLENMPLKDIDVVDRPENQTAQIGDTVIFRCRSRDWPQPKVHWTRRSDHMNLMEILQHESNTSDVLVLHNVTKGDSGFYTCFIGNDVIHKKLSARLTVIEEGERLQFEPACSLHIKRQVLVDHLHGCRTAEPVLLHYCMGTCGRSYYVPQMVTSDQTDFLVTASLNQTCQCCVGIVDSLRIVELDCPLGKKKRGFYTVPGDCQCQSCSVPANPVPPADTIKT